MADVQLINDLFPTASNTQRAASSPSELGQEDFLTLLVTQLENQDPTQPTDNMEFIAQMAQFGTVSGIQDLQESFGSFSSLMFGNQGLQAASLVDSRVMGSSDVGVLEAEGSVRATVEVPENTTNVNLLVRDASGNLVRSMALGPAQAGEFQIEWDGTDADGNVLPLGNYRFSAEAFIGQENQALQVNTHNRVASVSVDQASASILLNLDNGERINISEVQEFL